MEKTNELILAIIRGIVSCPDEVEIFVSDIQDDKGTIKQVNVKVAPADVGLCIGEKGQNAEALRRIVGLIGFQQTRDRVYVRIDSPKLPKKHFDYPSES